MYNAILVNCDCNGKHISNIGHRHTTSWYFGSAQRATIAQYYGQSRSSCFKLHILLQNATSGTALVDIEVLGGLLDWGVKIVVDIMECPIGFTQDKISGQCHCEQFLIVAMYAMYLLHRLSF